MSINVSTIKAGICLLSIGVALIFLLDCIVLADNPGSIPAGPTLSEDPLLTRFVKEALEKRPELAQAKATIQADLERVPQARAFPDPVFSLGIQNDGFRAVQIGKMESSWYTVMSSQTFPWYGKRDLRGDLITLGVYQAEADLERVRLSVQAEVERAYVDVLLVRDQLNLLANLEALWTQIEELTRTRYEVGEGAQPDILRAQLERSRLKQRRWALEAEERRRCAVLNRLRGHPLDEVIPTNRSLADVPDPVLPENTGTWEKAEACSPELRKSLQAIDQSEKLVELAKKDYFPDLTVSAGLMARGRKFDPMWQAGLSFTIPVWGRSKQSRVIEENRIRGISAQFGAETIRQLLRQRIMERFTLLNALTETNRLYRSGLLVQSEAMVSSTMAQYQMGRVAFASVLEALTGYIADVNSFYESVATTQRVEIAQRELSLDPLAGLALEGMSGASVPRVGNLGTSSSPAAGEAPPQSAGTTGSMAGM